MSGFDALLSTAMIQRLGWTLLHSLWEGAAVAGAFGLLLWIVPQGWARIRHAAGCGALLTIILLCGATFLMMPAPRPAGTAVATAASASATEIARPDLDADEVALAAGARPPASSPGEMSAVVGGEGRPADGGPRAASVAPVPVEPLSHRWTRRAEPLLPWMALAWAAGVLGLSLWRLGGCVAIYRLRRVGVGPVGDDIAAIARRFGERLRISRPVRVLQSVVIQTPAVVGHLRPMILLPISTLSGLPVDQLEAIIAHELAHVARHDYLIGLLQTAAEILLFHHPAVWWISRRIRIERECCCDDVALSLSRNRLSYARALAGLVELRSMTPRAAVAADGGSLVERIRRVLAGGRPSPRSENRRPAGLAVSMLGVTIALIVSTAAWIGDQKSPGQSAEAAQAAATASPDTQPATAPAASQLGQPADVHALIAALASPDDYTRKHAARDLGQLGDRRAVEPLIRALKDPVHYVRRDAAAALGNIGDPQAREPLMEALEQDFEELVRVSAARALAQLGGEEVVRTLVATLADDNAAVREQAGAGLDRLRWQPADKLQRLRHLLAKEEFDKAAELAVPVQISEAKDRVIGPFRLSEPMVGRAEAPHGLRTHWIEFREDGGRVQVRVAFGFPSGPKMRWNLAVALTKSTGIYKGDEVEAIAAEASKTIENGGFISGYPKWERQTAWFDLGKPQPLSDVKGFLLIVRALDEEGRKNDVARAEFVRRLASPKADAETRADAAEVLGDIGGVGAVDALIAALKDEDNGVRSAAVRALGRLEDARAVGPLIETFRDRKYEAFKAAMFALGDIGGRQAQETLAGALREEDVYTRALAAKALERSGWKPSDRGDKIRYLAAMEEWEEAVAAGPAAKASPGMANQAEGTVELDTPIVLALPLGHDQRPKPFGYPRLQFKNAGGRLNAQLDIRFSSWPRTKWLISCGVMGADGTTLGRAVATHATSGSIMRYVFNEDEVLPLSFDRDVDPAKAARFRFAMQSVFADQGNPLVLDKEFPLKLALSTIEWSDAMSAERVRFANGGEGLSAVVRVRWSSWPKAKWRTKVEVHDPQGDVVARGEDVVESSGALISKPMVAEADHRLNLEKSRELAQDSRYVVSIERVHEGAELDAARQAKSNRVLLEGRWPELPPADASGRRSATETPVQASCAMLEINRIEFTIRADRPRVDVRFQFRDGRMVNGALFTLELLDKGGGVLGTARVLELRNRELARAVYASVVVGGDDPPNRSGPAECYFEDIRSGAIAAYRLEVREPDVAELGRLLSDQYAYVRESAARALGQIGVPSLEAVPRLKQCLQDPGEHVRIAAKQALSRIPGAGD